MNVQIDIQKVGDSSKSGDAISVFVQNGGDDFLLIIDGGTKDSAGGLLSTIQTHYGRSYADLLVVTHGDADHASGAVEIINNFQVNNLACSFPWSLVDDIFERIDHGSITKESLKKNLQARYPYLDELEKIARTKTSPPKIFNAITETFNHYLYKIIGPTKEDYVSAIVSVLQDDVYETEICKEGVDSSQQTDIKKIKIDQYDDISLPDKLNDDGTTSPSNETSVVSLLTAGDFKTLFTGDAGIDSLKSALQYATARGIDFRNPDYLQIPHHGSLKCISRKLLQLINPKAAFVSCASSDPYHPSPTVINSLHKQNKQLYTTKSASLWLKNFTASRDGYYTAVPEGFHDKIERVE